MARWPEELQTAVNSYYTLMVESMRPVDALYHAYHRLQGISDFTGFHSKESRPEGLTYPLTPEVAKAAQRFIDEVNKLAIEKPKVKSDKKSTLSEVLGLLRKE